MRRVEKSMNNMYTNELIESTEKLILPQDKHFDANGRLFLNCEESKEIVACPGCGKTTLIMAKLDLLLSHYPLPNNRGICVLSHTNVAVDEINKRLGEKAKILLSYPNFVGTIQKFIDFYVMPKEFCKYNTQHNKIQIISEEEFAHKLWNLAFDSSNKFSTFCGFVKSKLRQTGEIETTEQYIKSLHLDNNENLKHNQALIAGSNTKSAQQFKNLKEQLWADGYLSYSDAYILAEKALDNYGNSFKTILAKRFKYVFVDEYQDCSKIQIELLNSIFLNTDTIYQRVGDIDQAIYSSIYADENIWDVSGDALILDGSNRFHQKIADVVSKLRTNNQKITSYVSQNGPTATLIVYDINKISDVLKTYAQVIAKYKLNAINNPVFKAIGMVKNGKGIVIDSYWKEFKNNKTDFSEEYFYYIQKIYAGLKSGDLSQCNTGILEIIKIASSILKRVDANGHRYTTTTIKDLMIDMGISYQSYLIQLTHMELTEDNVCDTMSLLLKEIFTESGCQKLNRWMSVVPNYVPSSSWYANNQWVNDTNKIVVSVDTVHGVKGETHTATLYLETEHSNNSDIRRILPLLKGKKLNKKQIYEKSRRIVYVGMSRPTHLLCLAIRDTTYNGNEDAFKDWDVIKIK